LAPSPFKKAASPALTLAPPTAAPCEIVTTRVVADLVGGRIYRQREQAPGPGGSYEVEAGPDGSAQFIV
jgi:hypothetical protein